MKFFNVDVKLSGISNFPQPTLSGPKTRAQSKKAEQTLFATIKEHVIIASSFLFKAAGVMQVPTLFTRQRSVVKVDRSSLEVWTARASAALAVANYILRAR